MNITNAINKGNYETVHTQEEILKSIGFKQFQRKICFFIKEHKNLYNIEGNNLVTKVGALIINIFKSEIDKRECYNKTVYLCDIEFLNTFDMNVIKCDISKFIDSADIHPLYAFANNHIISHDSRYEFNDYGLTMVDLSIKKSSYGVLNFSNATQLPLYKEIIYGNEYNPKYYTNRDAKFYSEIDDSRSGNINDIFDNRTKLICNKIGGDTVDIYTNNVKEEGIFIDKRTITINEFITTFFNKYMFLQFDDIEFIYDSRLSKPLNIKKLTTFTKFEPEAQEYYIEHLMDDISDIIKSFSIQLNEDFYMVFYINDQYAIIDITLFKDNKEIRITKPLYKLYGEFALDSEEILNNIETSGELAKCDMLDYVHQDMKGIEFIRDISGAISMIDNATKSLSLMIESNKADVKNLIEGESCLKLRDDRERYLSSPKN